MTDNRRDNPLLQAALAYAARGWRVHPLKPRDKLPTLKGWPEKATTDPAIIKQWWARSPNANIGIATGTESGVLLLDVDGPEALAQLNGRHLPPTPMANSGREEGGVHYYLKAPAHCPCKNHILPKVDVKGTGGYVVAPPSLHPNGRPYTWAVSPDDIDLAPAPEWLVDLLGDPPQAGATNVTPPTVTGADAKSVEGVADGEGRHGALLTLAGAMRRRGAGEAPILAALRAANATHRPPRPDADLVKMAGSMLKYESAPDLRLTELGLAEQFRNAHKDRVRWCGDLGKWLNWTGSRWQVDETGETLRLAKQTVMDLCAALPGIPDDKAREAMRKFIAANERDRALRAILSLAQSELPLPVRYADFDADGWKLNCANGILDLRTGALLPHDPDALCLKQAPVHFDPDAQCPRWLAFLETVMGGKQALISFLQMAVGASLPAHTREQIMLILHGSGSNGKTTFGEAITGLLGDYAQTAEARTLLSRRNDEGARNDLAALAGARAVLTSEVGAGKRLDETLVKRLTGSDSITARFLFREHFTFTPGFRLWMYTNHTPDIRETSHAMWRRVRLVPFTVTIPDAEQDKALPEKLQAEYPGILTWALAGCLAWQAAGGLEPPEEVTAATAAYRDESDVLGQFIAACCVTGPDKWVLSSDLREEYTDFCKDEKERPLSAVAFGKALRERGFTDDRTYVGAKQHRVWRCVGLCVNKQ